MRPQDLFALASRIFRAKKLRTFLTILGTSIGIGAILFLVAFGYGLQNVLLEKISSSDALLSLTVNPQEEGIVNLDRGSLDKMRAISEVTEVAPLSVINGQINFGSLTTGAVINAVNTNYFRLADIKTSRGSVFKEGERGKIVVSSAIMRLFNIDEPDKLLGKEIKLDLFIPREQDISDVRVVSRGDLFIISGIIDDEYSSFVYVPIEDISEDMGTDTVFAQAQVKVSKESHIDKVRTEIADMGFYVSSLSDTIEEATKVFRAIQIILALFGIVALIVSAIGMFNTMTIALLERTQEIGIMKALGATNGDIWKLFLAESVIIGFLGGIGGIAIGFIGGTLVDNAINLLARSLGGESVVLFSYPTWFIITILVFATVIGLSTGLWPARRAAYLNPLEALRYK
ncbi:MAG: hypothetical protein AUJ75_02920 [Candidatus Omnitrophica bacterium CG1_02_49_10]|nr:MAG: hypothetical protein AUJ75_02920 [Candidatus Omnitrophica bacterium CG1_02_49_10]